MPLRHLLLSLLAILSAGTVCARIRGEAGVQAAMEITVPSNAYKTGTGLSLGPVYRIPLSKGIFFEPGVLFTYSAMNTKELIRIGDDALFEGSAKKYGLRLPLRLGYSFDPLDILSVGVYTGPELNFNISARQTLDPNFALDPPVPRRSINLFDHGWKHVDLMWGFGLSFRIAQNYHVGISGGVGITPLAKFGNKDKKVRIHRNIVAITLGYYF